MSQVSESFDIEAEDMRYGREVVQHVELRPPKTHFSHQSRSVTS